jgi:hypothetical protein
MKPVICLRIASVLTLIHSILHTVGGVLGKPVSSVAARVAAEMRTTFPAFGAIRSYSDFYLGMGLGVTIFLTMDALLLWVLASMAKNDPARLRPLIAIFAVGYLAFAFNSYAFFFAGPVIFELLIVSCLIAAIITAKPITSHYATAEPSTHKAAQL